MKLERNSADIAFLEDLYALPDKRQNPAPDETAPVPDRAGAYGGVLWLNLWNHLQRMYDSWQW
jgi:hypothetical protein